MLGGGRARDGNKILEDPSLKGGLIKKTKLQECDESMEPEEDGTTMMGLGSKGEIYFVLQNASLVAAYVGKRYQILNPNKHANFLRRKNKNPYDYRPDIVHEALLQIMGSRICMAGRVHGVFIKTDEGILIRVEPNTQIPKTLESFCNMMAELLQKFSIKSKGNRGKLLRLIENPVTQHLPINSRKIGLSVSSPKAVQINDYVATANHDENLVFVVGAMAHGKIQQQSLVPLSGVFLCLSPFVHLPSAHGKIDVEYVDDLISVSALPLSAGTCLRRICVTLERNQKIH
ncbi:hypothetical protein AHAS_Ahas02G0082000 [Arachis hypogaea]